MMKKICTLILGCMVSLATAFGAEIRTINFPLIKNAESYKDKILPVLNNSVIFADYHGKQFWNFNVSYEEAEAAAVNLYDAICANKEDNAEYYLLKAIASDYLYNFDKISYTEAENNYLELINNEDHDYRCEWFLAKFYGNSTRVNKALELITKVVDQVPEKEIHPVVYYDYGMIATYSFMPGTALKAFETYSRLSGCNVEAIPMYNTIKKCLKDYDGGNLNINDVFRDFAINDESFLFSRFTGCYLNLDPGLQVEKGGALSSSSFYFVLKSQPITAKNISYTICPYICATQDAESSDAYKLLEKIKSQCEMKEVRFKTNIKGLKVYEYKNDDKYPEVGGMHGMVALFTVDYSDDADIRLDTPYEIGKLDEPVKFFQIPETYRRYQGPVTYAILLDSCGDIYSQSVKDFVSFLNNSRFE